MPWSFVNPIRFTAKSRGAKSKLKAVVSDVLKDQQQHSLKVPKQKRSVKHSNPNRHSEKIEDGSCSRCANGGFRHDDQSKGKEKGDKQQRTPNPTKRQPTLDSEDGNPTGKTRKEDTWCMKCLFVHLSEDDQSSSPTCQSKSDKIKDPNMIAKATQPST